MRAHIIRCDLIGCNVEKPASEGETVPGWITFEGKDFDCYRCLAEYARIRSQEIRTRVTLGYDVYDESVQTWEHDTQ